MSAVGSASRFDVSLGGAALAVVAVVWWLVEVARSWGGWDAPSVTIGAALLALAVVVVRPDRVLPGRAVGLATAISAGAIVVPLVAPVGWAGARGAAPYVCAAWLAVLVAATVVRWPASELLLVVLIVVSAPIQFMSGWVAWWGGRDSSIPMVGTFYWHNPYAAFLIPGGIVGLALWIWQDRLFALLGILAFVFATMGIVYSTSRASLATYVVGIAALAIVAAIGKRRLRDWRQIVLAAVFGGAATYAVGGPPFFPHRSTPFAGTEARGVGEPVAQNTHYRLDFWREALTVFHHHPITGGGYKSLYALASPLAPKSWPVSSFAHNGYMQALSDGGLLLGAPFLVSIAALVVIALRVLARGIRDRDQTPSRLAVPVAFVCVLLHSGADFDWMYPASMAMAAILGGLVLGVSTSLVPQPALDRSDSVATRTLSSRWRVSLAACVVVGVSALGLAAFLMRDGDHNFSLTRNGEEASRFVVISTY